MLDAGLHPDVANRIMADDDAASDGNKTRFTYVTNNIGHTSCSDR